MSEADLKNQLVAKTKDDDDEEHFDENQKDDNAII